MRILKTGWRGKWLKSLLIFLSVLLAGGAWCADTSDSTDPLLDLFIQKGYVTQQEADQVKAEADQLRSNELANASMPAMKWKVNDYVKNMEIFGDVRLRYEDRSAKDPGDNEIDDQRMRYALRFGLRGDLFDDYYFGFRLETSSNPRSTWVSMGNSSSGPFGKSTAGLNIGQIYLGWHPQDWLNITLGKMPNPLYTTPMVWDGDLNPEGAAERFKYTVGEADFFATFGQFLYGDFNPNTASKGLGVNGLLGQNTQNIFMFASQGGMTYHITTNTYAKIAATIYNYVGLQRSSANSGSSLSPYFGDPYVGEGAYYYNGGTNLGYADGYAGYGSGQSLPGYESSNYPFNQVGLDHLLVVEVPFEFDFKISKLDARLFGDVAYNLDGAQRAQEAAAAYTYILSQAPPTQNAIPHSFPAQTHDVKAYQIGFDIASAGDLGLLSGAKARKHAWEFSTYWQHVEQYALDPNIIDSDIFEGRENLQGICVAMAYGITGNLVATIRYAHANRINDLLGTGGDNQDIPQMNPINSFNLFQADLTLKF
jgi:Putative porin